MRRILLMLGLVLGLALPASAAATTHWAPIEGGPTGGWVDPGDLPDTGPPIGGDGGTCDIGAALDGCEVSPNPCAGWECNGDEGTGEVCINEVWIVLCNVNGPNQPPPYDPPYEGTPDPGDTTPTCEDWWNGVGNGPPPAGCRALS